MITISLCLIVKDEEEVIGRCLESVQGIVDEINIVDTGSTDRTKEIVGQYTDRVFDFAWIDDFAAARNFAFQQATREYILWLDADDVLKPEDQEKFRKLKKEIDSSIDAVSMSYHLGFDESGSVSSSSRRYRLVKRDRNFQWIGAVHEYLAVYGKLIDSDVAITHQPISHDANRNITIYEGMIAAGKEFTARDYYYYANELVDHGQYEKAIQTYIRFLDTKKGWVEDNIRACYQLADCYSHLKIKEKELEWVLQSLRYDAPRSETCCRLGYYFFEQNQFQAAIYWYEQAIQCKDHGSMAIQNNNCSTWLPHLQLCVCYDRIGQHERASEHNELAGQYRPNDPSIIANRKYLDNILNK
ncbi:glycosyltransferase family 2 protein [Rossellomorea yichunensis]|uniref:glycosyltransferase family 2 protein n=1 Tax=Rossellomorea yichunensis TaxID=3077331 RepID=UPI0028DE97F0|nr:glycosyltransferase family 2 protein [Rossellomorea sp. YC4-1]MDT9027818.1 glycosyltransferase family 2 protein [Rossellomorea sp. YC4-1]